MNKLEEVAREITNLLELFEGQKSPKYVRERVLEILQQTTHPLNLEIEQLRKERDEFNNKNNNQFYTLTETIKDLKETSKQLQAEKQKNEELIKLLKECSEYLMNYSDGIEPVFAVNQTREEIEQLLNK